MTEQPVEAFNGGSLESYLSSGAVRDESPIRIWHLSDPHFDGARSASPGRFLSKFPGLHSHSEDTWNAVRNIITKERNLPDCLVISGDISSTGARADFVLAKDRILRLVDGLEISRERLVVVPGNHDRFLGYMIPFPPTRSRAYEEFFGDFSHPRTIEIGGKRVLLYPFDSTEEGFRLWPFFANTGLVSRAQFNEFNAWVGEVGRENVDVVVIVLHHHPLPVPEINLEGLTVMKNGGAFMAHMQNQNVDLVLHGHMHHCYSCRISYGENSRDTVISAAGTVCQGGSGRCSLSIIEIHPSERIVIRVYRYFDTGFIPDANRGRVFRLVI